ncbi:MAG TPA: peptidyl-prolyl cis-trans isomerase [Rhodothermales bacterium]|nr:peptidyl-prolyl cis-trans isomerase [Rhodothermales bacterium]
MRENTPIVLWILVIAFGGIWVLQDSGVFETQTQARFEHIASVDGEPISYQEYTRAIESQRQQYELQTGESMPPQLFDLYRDQIFDAMVDDILRRREMERLGVVVSDAEVVEMVLGDNPDPLIRQQFGDGNGQVDRDLLRSLIDNPEVREDWIRVEEYLRTKRRAEKFDKLIEATVRVSVQEVNAEYVKRNRKADAQYVALRYAEIPDDSISVTERELGAFYNEHRDDYHRDRTIAVDYVRYSKTASATDTAAVLQEMSRMRSGFTEAEDDSLYLVLNGSEKSYTNSYFSADELDPELAAAVVDSIEPGRVVGPIIVRNQVHLAKIGDVRPAEDQSVHARHILISSAATDDAATREAAMEEANDLKTRLAQGADFAALAMEFSDDPGSGANGGDLGWFGPGRMVEPFEKAAFEAHVGQLVGPIETQFGYHLIEVLAKVDKEFQFADLVLTIRPSLDTIGNAEDGAADLGYFAQESGDFAAEVAKHDDLTLETVQVQEEMDVIPGLGSSQDIKKFLTSAKVGDISEVIELNDDFVVLHVSEITPSGYRSFEEVRAELEPQARLEKKKQIQVERLRAAAQGKDDLEAIAEAASTIRRTASAVTQNNTLVPGMGREPKFVGAALGLGEGVTSPVIEGANAAYILTVTRLYEADPSTMTAAQRASLQNELMNRKKQRMTTRWLAELREAADVSDFRYRF